MSCKKVLRPRHMVPILSWLLLRGKCAYCKARIHFQYPLVEAAAAILTVIAALRNDPFGPMLPAFIFETAISLGLLTIVVMDLRWKELPLELMAGIGFLGLVYRIGLVTPLTAQNILSASVSLAAAVGLAIAFFGLQWVVSSGKWLGSGDVWFGAMMGFVLGTWPQTAIAIYLAYLIGGFVVSLFFLGGVVKRGMHVAFAPALALGLLLTIWFGPAIEAHILYAFT
jgi:leader peptidase (prepilin peptidase)/N-methyltransferase